MGSEELWLLLAAVATLGIPPSATVAVDEVARCTGDLDVGAGDGDEWSRPFLVAEGRGTLKDDLDNDSQPLTMQAQ